MDADAESRARALKELEDLTSRRFRSRDDIRKFLAESAPGKEAARSPRLRIAKQATLLALLVAAFGQYYALDVLIQMASIRSLTVFVPVTERDKAAPGAKPTSQRAMAGPVEFTAS